MVWSWWSDHWLYCKRQSLKTSVCILPIFITAMKRKLQLAISSIEHVVWMWSGVVHWHGFLISSKRPNFNYEAEVMLCKPRRVYSLYYYLKYLSSIKYGQRKPLYARYMFGTHPLWLNDVSQREHVSFDTDLTKDFTWYKTVWYLSKLLQ